MPHKYRIKPSRYEHNDPEVKAEMRKFIQQFEERLKKKLQHSPIDIDLTHVVPRQLYGRTGKIVPLKPYDDREFEQIVRCRMEEAFRCYNLEDQDTDSLSPETGDRDEDEDGDGEDRLSKFEMRIDPKTKPRELKLKEVNWMESFLRKTRKERIKWQTKLYKSDKKLLEKPLFEQVEELIDLGAQDFAEWLNTLGAEKSNITKDIIKQLFSIGVEGDSAKALYVEPKEIRAIPAEVARDWNLHYMALQRKIAQVMRSDRAQAKVRERHVAFGRTLPMEMRRFRRFDDIDEIVPNFPPETKTFEKVFKGICHLRSVRVLVDHLKQHPEIHRPKYLVDLGMFREKEAKPDDYVPLYEKYFKWTASEGITPR
ncbi:uncharacterized protein LOC6053666 [Culex quinquefasciatus]|uniref:uncharacterized protein LOC6053666 n=1 Tax=Culex quinquefasciatus TaxID=7176 RepID=UPI0018E2B1B2|nr:uncharacterized protein LOC6053666 [Culex quinquefasciatus]